MTRALLALAFTLSAAAAPTPPAAPAAPPPPAAPPAPVVDTDVFVATLDLAGGKVGAPRNITERVGYDNQPAFTLDGRAVLYVVAGEGGNSEVHRYELASGARAQVTDTPEAEYSPTPLAGGGFSAVRVEAPGSDDGEVFTESQRLFRYGDDGKPVGPVLAARRIGYHAWIDDDHVAVFLVGGGPLKLPNTLALATLAKDGASEKVVPLAKDIGRSLGRSPDGRVTFVDQGVADAWTVATVMPSDTKPAPLVATHRVPGEKDGERSQDFVWLPDGTLLMARGNRFLRFDPRKPEAGLMPFAELADLPGDIKRLAVSRDGKQLAFVVEIKQVRTRGIRG